MAHHPLHLLHEGELIVQKRRNTPRDLTQQLPGYIQTNMPSQHAEFYSELPYLPLTTLDNQGRPWVSLLITHSKEDAEIGINVLARSQLDVRAETNPYDPLVRALMQVSKGSENEDMLFAGVGVDFSNRRRNKLSGKINSADLTVTGKVNLTLSSDQHLGNCPKYITVRSLEHHRRQAKVLFDQFDGSDGELPEFCKTLIDQASTAFLATKHTQGNDDSAEVDQRDMGLNHRGGAPGFIRVYEETDGNKVSTYLIIPDHSGNRFYQSLGNIQTNTSHLLNWPF